MADPGPSSTDALPGALRVTVLAARDLTPKNKNGLSNPYAKVKVNDDLSFKTAVLKNTINPEWTSEEGFFPLEDLRQSSIVVKVWDKGFIGKDFEGMAYIPLMRLNPGITKDAWYDLTPRPNKSKDRVSGQVHIRLHFTPEGGTTRPATASEGSEERRSRSGTDRMSDLANTANITIDDFDIVKVLGRGQYGKVLQVRKKDSGTIYAMKVIKKASIASKDDVEHTLAEREVAAHTNHPFMVHLHWSFQTEDCLYLVLDFVQGGDVFFHFQFADHFSEGRVRLYAAEIGSVFEYIHEHGIIYRDLKPENILLDLHGHVRLADFGLCKTNLTEGGRTSTFCGTPHYLAPEQLVTKDRSYDKAVDWWALGCVLWEMLFGLPPFYDENIQVAYQKTKRTPHEFPDFPCSDDLKDLLNGLLTKDPAARLGSGATGSQDFKSHPFFSDLDWAALMRREITPEYRPKLKNRADILVLDEVAAMPVVINSMVDEDQNITASVQAAFEGFSWNANDYSLRPTLSTREDT